LSPSRAIRQNQIVAALQCFVATPEFSCGGAWLSSLPLAALFFSGLTPELTGRAVSDLGKQNMRQSAAPVERFVRHLLDGIELCRQR